MTSIIESIKQFFVDEEWVFTALADESILGAGFQGENGNWMCYAQAREEQQQFVFYSVCPIKVPVHKRDTIAEFITRANYGLVIGNFEMDFDDGEVRYKTSIDVEGAELNAGLVRTLVYSNLTMMDRYYPGLMTVIYGGLSPADALTQLEEEEGAAT